MIVGGILKIIKGAKNSKSSVKCDALILDDKSKSDTIPFIEINEEKEIAELAQKISEDTSFNVKFDELEKICQVIFPDMAKKVNEFIGIPILPVLKLEYLGLKEFKKMKGRKVFSSDDARGFVDELFDAVADKDVKKIAELIKRDPAKFISAKRTQA